MIKDARYGAMDQEGYISSETMWDHENPFHVVVASTWRTIDNWENWKSSDFRKSKDVKFDEFLDGKTEYEIFEVGMYPH